MKKSNGFVDFLVDTLLPIVISLLVAFGMVLVFTIDCSSSSLPKEFKGNYKETTIDEVTKMMEKATQKTQEELLLSGGVFYVTEKATGDVTGKSELTLKTATDASGNIVISGTQYLKENYTKEYIEAVKQERGLEYSNSELEGSFYYADGTFYENYDGKKTKSLVPQNEMIQNYAVMVDAMTFETLMAFIKMDDSITYTISSEQSKDVTKINVKLKFKIDGIDMDYNYYFIYDSNMVMTSCYASFKGTMQETINSKKFSSTMEGICYFIPEKATITTPSDLSSYK